MDTIKILIGTLETLRNGASMDSRREVVFEGERLGSQTTYDYDVKQSAFTDTRGTTETLYRAADGRLVVHIKDWSRWRGEPTTESIHLVTESDLQPGGRFKALGAACGFGRPLSLDEALALEGAGQAGGQEWGQ